MAKKKLGTPPKSHDQPTIAGYDRELIVVMKPDAEIIPSTTRGFTSAIGLDVSSLATLLETEGVQMTPLFGENQEQLRPAARDVNETTGEKLPDLSIYYKVEAPDEALEDLAEKLRQNELVDGAYVKPQVFPAVYTFDVAERSINDIEAPATPNFSARQGYLDAAPGGVDARHAWTKVGGRGFDVRIIDIEGGWNLTHEDLLNNTGGVISGTNSTDPNWQNHGTAVAGEIGGDNNNIGITGICSDANLSYVSIMGSSPAAAIRLAADRLRPGDIILIELHAPGPRFNFQGRADQRGYIAMEFWPDVFDAIRYAVNRGVIVVEAAGNGAENLDDALYNTRPTGFPSTWSNPFVRGNRDSGAILVGAGAPPPGTHGANHGPDRSRLDFSNFGAAVDSQGWGREVTTCGYGDLQGGANNQIYTDRFSGTSSASPIIVGSLGCVQGHLRASGRIPLTPSRARNLLRATGTPQQDAPGRPATQRIGNRPDLKQMIANVSGNALWSGLQFTGNLAANQTMKWFTFNWPAHWHVLWNPVPLTPKPGGPEIRWKVQVERASDQFVTYWIEITNLTNIPIQVEGRFTVLGW